MARLQIVNREPQKPALTSRDLLVLIDGQEIDHITELRLRLHPDELNECEVVFTPTEVVIDADVLALLEAWLKK